MTGAHSRRKGAGGELEAAEELTRLLGFPWRRTAQRWGKAKADIEPCDSGRINGVHVEVKRYVGGLKWWTNRVVENPEQLFLAEKYGGDLDSLYFCALEAIHKHAGQQTVPIAGPRQGSAVRWMAQAVRDAEDGDVPLILCRQDRSPWIMAWRYQDDDRLWCRIRTATA